MTQQYQHTMGERAVLAALAKGLSPQAIARELGVHIGFVRATLQGLRLRYGARNLAELAERIERGALPMDVPPVTASSTPETELHHNDRLQDMNGSGREGE